jgi:hypothetical protein
MKPNRLQKGVLVLGLTGALAVLGGGAAMAAVRDESPGDSPAAAEARRHARSTPVIDALGELTGLSKREIVAQLFDGKTFAQIAESHGSSGDALVDEVLANASDRLEDAVASGYISQERSDEILANLEEFLPKLVFGEVDWRPGHPLRRFALLDEVADTIGITVHDLRDSLAEGQSMADVAEANGVSEEALEAALMEALGVRLADLVEDDKIEQALADEILSAAPARIDELVNHVFGGPDNAPVG